MNDILGRIEAYLEQHEDVRDGGDRRPLPNEAMLLLMELRQARTRPEGGENSARPSFCRVAAPTQCFAPECDCWQENKSRTSSSSPK